MLVAAAAFLNPVAFGIAVPVLTPDGALALINPVSRIEMGLGVAIGAITFSGSVIAFLKLNGNMGGTPNSYYVGSTRFNRNWDVDYQHPTNYLGDATNSIIGQMKKCTSSALSR